MKLHHALLTFNTMSPCVLLARPSQRISIQDPSVLEVPSTGYYEIALHENAPNLNWVRYELSSVYTIKSSGAKYPNTRYLPKTIVAIPRNDTETF